MTDSAFAYDDVSFMASLASESYKLPLERQTTFSHPLHGPVHLVSNEQNFAVYETSDTQHVFVTHRGTDLGKADTAWQDIVNDFNIALDRDETLSRIREADASLVKYTPSTNITHVGHSLGGTIANHAAHQTKTRSVVFNPGASPFHTPAASPVLRRGYPVNWYTDQTVEHRIYNHQSDVISSGASHGIYGDEQVHISSLPTTNAHGLDNFKNL